MVRIETTPGLTDINLACSQGGRERPFVKIGSRFYRKCFRKHRRLEKNDFEFTSLCTARIPVVG